MKRFISLTSIITILISVLQIQFFGIAANPTLTNLDITNPTFWVEDTINKASFDLGILNLPNGEIKGVPTDLSNKLFGAKTSIQNYTTSFNMMLNKKAGTTLGTTGRLYFILRSKEINTTSFISTSTKNGYWLDFTETSVNLMMGTKIVKYCASLGVAFADGNYHSYQITLYDNDVGGVTVTVVVDTKTIVSYSNNATDPILTYNNQPTGYTDRLLGLGNMQISTTNLNTYYKPQGYVVPSNIDIKETSFWSNIVASGATSDLGVLTLPSTTATNFLTSSNTNINNYQNKFDLKFNSNLGTTYGTDSKFYIVLKSKELNTTQFLSTSSRNGYYLDFYATSFNLVMKDKILKYNSLPNINLADGEYHSFNIECYDNYSGGVSIKVTIDGKALCTYSNNGVDPIVDRLGVDTTFTDRFVGGGNMQIIATKGQVCVKEVGAVVPVIEAVNITNKDFWVDSSSVNLVQNYPWGMFLPNGETTNIGNKVNYLLGKRNDLINFNTSLQMKINKKAGSTMGSTSKFRMVVKSKESATTPFFNSVNNNGYYLDFFESSFNLVIGKGEILAECPSQGINFSDGQYHNYDIQVYDNANAGINIKVIVDSKLLLNYSNNGTQPILDKDGVDTGITNRMIGQGNVQIWTENTESIIGFGSLEPTNLPILNFGSTNVWKEGRIATEIKNNSVRFPSGSITNGLSGWNILYGNSSVVTDYEANFKMRAIADDANSIGENSKLYLVLKSKEEKSADFYLNKNPKAYYVMFYKDSFNLIYGTKILSYCSTGTFRPYDGNYNNYKIKLYDNESGGVTIKMWINDILYLNYSNDGTAPILDWRGVDTGFTDRLLGEGSLQIDALRTDIAIIGNADKDNLKNDMYFVDKDMWNWASVINTGNIVIPEGTAANGYINNIYSKLNTYTDIVADFNINIVKGAGNINSDDFRAGIALRYQGSDGKIPFSQSFDQMGYYLMFRDNSIELKMGTDIYATKAITNLSNGVNHNVKLAILNVPGGVNIYVWVDNNLAISYLDISNKRITKPGLLQVVTRCSNVSITGEKNIPNTPLKVLFIGNSITKHAPNPAIGWNGDFGMAASSEDKDYVHQTMKKAYEKYPDADFMAVNVATFESAFSTYNLGNLASARDYDADIIIMRIGENTQDAELQLAQFNIYYLKLIDYLNKSNKAKIICTTAFWKKESSDDEMIKAARSRNYPLVRLGQLGDDDANKAIGLFEDPSVASHPNDLGMLRIAEAIYASVGDILNGGDGHVTYFRKNTLTGVSVEFNKGDFPNNSVMSDIKITDENTLNYLSSNLSGYGILSVFDITILNNPSSKTGTITMPRPRYTTYKDLLVYFKNSDGTLTQVYDVTFKNMDVIINAGVLGTYIIVETIDADGIFSDETIDGSEIASFIANSTNGMIKISYLGLEKFTLRANAFGAIITENKALLIVFADGTMTIPSNVFAALSEPYRDITFSFGALTSIDIDSFTTILTDSRINTLNQLFYEIGIRRDSVPVSIALPIKITINKQISGASGKLFMVCMEEDNTLTTVPVSYSNGVSTFEVYNFNFYSMTNSEIENVNTGDKNTNLFLIFSILAALGMIYSSKKKKLGEK